MLNLLATLPTGITGALTDAEAFFTDVLDFKIVILGASVALWIGYKIASRR